MLVLIIVLSVIAGIALPVTAGFAGRCFDEENNAGTVICLIAFDICIGLVFGGVIALTNKAGTMTLEMLWMVGCISGALMIPVAILLLAGLIQLFKGIILLTAIIADALDRKPSPRSYYEDDADYMDDYMGY